MRLDLITDLFYIRWFRRLALIMLIAVVGSLGGWLVGIFPNAVAFLITLLIATAVLGLSGCYNIFMRGFMREAFICFSFVIALALLFSWLLNQQV